MASLVKEIESIDADKLLEFYYSIENTIGWHVSSNKTRQSSLQYDVIENEYIAGCGKMSGNDTGINKISDIYKNTILESIITRFKLVRTRWMWVEPYACYSIHNDSYPRIHIPLVTYEHCYFVFPNNEEKILHLPKGKIYWLNTLPKHTFINCTDKPRLHIVGSFYGFTSSLQS